MNTINSKTGAAYAMKAPEIADDNGKKTEVVFPTAETVHPVADERQACIVPLRRHATVVNLGEVTEGVFLVLVPEPANLNMGAIVAVEFGGAGAVAVCCCADPDNLDPETDIVCGAQGDEGRTTAVVLVWDGTRLVPCGDSSPLCNEQLTPKVENWTASAAITKHDTYIRIDEKLVQDSTLELNTKNAPLGARVIVRFECGSTAYELGVKDHEGGSTEIQGTADETTVKELVWNGSGFDVIG